MKILFWILGDNISLSFLSKSRFQKSVLSAASRPLLSSVDHASHYTKNITLFAMYEFITAELFKIQVFWDTKPLNYSSYRRSKRRWYLKNVSNFTNRYDVPSMLASITSLCPLWTTVLRILGTEKGSGIRELFIFSGSRFSYLSRNETLTEAFRNVFRSSEVICCNKVETLLFVSFVIHCPLITCHLKVSAFPVSSQE